MYSTCYVWSTSGNIGCFGCKDHLKKFTFSSFLPLPFNDIPLQRRSPKRTCFLVKRATIKNFWKITTMLDLYAIYLFFAGKNHRPKKGPLFCVYPADQSGIQVPTDPFMWWQTFAWFWTSTNKGNGGKNPSDFFWGETLGDSPRFQKKRHPRISYT